jgi:hypothetical protein
MAHAANIVPQFGKTRPKSGIETVSYQITSSLQCQTGKNSAGSQCLALAGLCSEAKSLRITVQSSSSREASL